jgi:cell wall-associated NlpC family hydrolase
MRFYVSLSLAVLTVCSSAMAAEAPAQHQLGMQPASVAGAEQSGWSNSAQEILINALSLTGIKYKYGGNSPETGFDCSGFVRYVFQQAANLTLPHGARALSQIGQTVPVEQLRPGDLVFFNTLKSAFSHVGIYLGNNRFIHAPSSGGGIHVVNMTDDYWSKRFNGARRIDSAELKTTDKSAPQ